MYRTFTGVIGAFLRFLNRFIYLVFIFSGAWIPLISISIYTIYRYTHFRRPPSFVQPLVWIVSIALGGLWLFFNLRKYIITEKHNPLGVYNIPAFMVKPSREKIGFFFGTKTKKKFFMKHKYYVGKPIDKDGHILVVGGAGSHKTSALAIPTLETWSGLVLAIDVKVNGNLLKEWRRLNANTGKSVKVFNPMSKTACGYDPYALLRDGGGANFIHNARELALAILKIPPDLKDPIWIKAAQNLLTATILFCFSRQMTFNDTMHYIQITPVEDLIGDINNSRFEPAMMYISKLHGLELKNLAGVGLDLTSLVVFAVDDLIKNSFNTDNKRDVIDWHRWSNLEIGQQLYDIILQIPEDKFDQWENAMMLMINQLIRTLERRAEKTGNEGAKLPPILIMLDEFPRMGKIEAIKSALATLRSRGVTICLIVQSLAQLDEIYGEKARRTIVDNCPYKAILNVTDADSQSYFSRIAGTHEVVKVSQSVQYSAEELFSTGESINRSLHRENIIHPHELALFDGDFMLMTPKGYCRVDKAPYYEEDSFKKSKKPIKKMRNVIKKVIKIIKVNEDMFFPFVLLALGLIIGVLVGITIDMFTS